MILISLSIIQSRDCKPDLLVTSFNLRDVLCSRNGLSKSNIKNRSMHVLDPIFCEFQFQIDLKRTNLITLKVLNFILSTLKFTSFFVIKKVYL